MAFTNWAQEPTLQDLVADLEAAKPSHDIWVSNILKWQKLINATPENKGKTPPGRSKVQSRLIRTNNEWRYSALTEPFLSSEKIFSVYPVSFEDDAAAKQNELVLNWQFRTKLNKVKFIDELVRTVVDEGTAIVRISWERVVKTVNKKTPVFSHYPITNEEDLNTFKSYLDLANSNPQELSKNLEASAAVSYFLETQTPTLAKITDTTTSPIETILENKPKLQIQVPQNIYIDPSCNGDIANALFVVCSFETNLAELTSAGIYKNLENIDWSGNGVGSNPDHESTTPIDFSFRDAARKKAVAYEYWGYYDIDGTGELTAIVATWIGNTLIRLEKNPYPDQKLPFVLISYMPVKREVYGEPDAELLENHQKISGAVTRGMIDLLGRSANGQLGIPKGYLDPINSRKFELGSNYEYNANSNPAGIKQHTYPEIPNSALTLLSLQNQSAEAITGVKAFSGGISGDSLGKVATGIRGALDAASKREMAILRRLAEGIREIGTKLIALNSEFLSEKEVVRVTNSEFVTIDREDLKGNFDLIIDISTAEVDNEKAQDLAFMLQTVGPNMEPQLYMQILSQIAELKRMPKLANTLKNWQPTPNPAQQQTQQLELQKLQLEISVLQAQLAKTQAETKLITANADRKNLDFVETEGGTSHARNLELAQAQARANQNLEITKALLRERNPNMSSGDIEAAIGFNALSGKL